MKHLIILSLTIISFLSLDAQERQTREQLMSGSKNTETLIDKPFIFTKGELQVSGNDVTNKKAFQDAIAKSNAVIKEYKEEINKFLATNPSPYSYNNKLNSCIAKARGLESDILLTEKEFKQGTSLGGVYYLQKLYLYQGYLEGITKVFPENQKLKDYLKTVGDAINAYGSKDQFMTKMEENQKSYTKNSKMIPAAQSNPKIEAMVKKNYEATFKEFTVTKVNITYSTWIIDKNELDIPICRKLSVCLSVKNNKGECGIGSSNVKEDYMGGGTYGDAYSYLPSDPIIVPCENIK